MKLKTKLSTKNKHSKSITTFTKSFKPVVPLPRDGSACKLHFHYRHFLRQIVSRLDHMAGLDVTGERFTWEGNKNLTKHCKEFDSEGRFVKNASGRMVRECLKFLRAQGVYTVEIKTRNGAERTGRVVAKHDDLTKIMDSKICVFCGATSTPTSTPTSAKASNDFRFDFPLDFHSTPQKNNGSKGIQASDESFVISNVISNPDASSFSSLNMNGKKEEHSIPSETFEAELNVAFPVRGRILSDGISGNSLERTLDIISDGLFQTAALNYYQHCPELMSACNHIIERFGQEVFVTRKNCHTVMQRVMEDLKAQDINAPRGWVPVLRNLLQTQKEPLRVLPDALDVFESGSVLLSFESLTAQAQLLNRAAQTLGVPGSWSEAVTFLTAVKERLEQNCMHVPSELIQGLAYFEARADDRILSEAAST